MNRQSLPSLRPATEKADPAPEGEKTRDEKGRRRSCRGAGQGQDAVRIPPRFALADGLRQTDRRSDQSLAPARGVGGSGVQSQSNVDE